MFPTAEKIYKRHLEEIESEKIEAKKKKNKSKRK